MKSNWNFQKGGAQTKKTLHGVGRVGIDIFWKNTISNITSKSRRQVVLTEPEFWIDNYYFPPL